MAINIMDLMTFHETKELSKISYKHYEEIEGILKKPFVKVTIEEILTLAGTSIFDVHFTDGLFVTLFKRWCSYKEGEK